MGIAVCRTRHGLLCYEDLDRTIGASLRMYGEWAEEEIYLLSSFIDPGSVVLDIGANIGTHALAFSRFVTSQGRVIAVDAQERAHDLLVLNMALNGARHVRCIRALAGRETGLRFVRQDEEANADLGAAAYLDPSPINKPEPFLTPLPMITLDDLSVERCDLIKIDVEAMELDVLVGAKTTIEHFRPPIYFEQAREQRFPETVDLLQQAGYSLFWHAADPFNQNNFRGQAVNIFGGTKEINILALPREQVEARRSQTASLQPVLGPVYEPPPRENVVSKWALPETAYRKIPPILPGSPADFVASRFTDLL